MIFRSLCSGIEAASVAWHPLGWLQDNRRGIEVGVKIMADERVKRLTSEAEAVFGGYEIAAVRRTESDLGADHD